ncbi:type II toxin-antitoxin system RelB/DinJ family antitoxin (plasmid) [Zobellella denitrificans]
MAVAMKTDVRSRVDEGLKREASDVLEGCGLNVSSAIRLFLEQVVQEQKLPFEVKRRPSAKMRRALLQAKMVEEHFNSLDDMMAELDNGKDRRK